MAKLDFHNWYRPAVANPHISDPTYVNIAASARFQPYIRCFWGSTCDFNPNESFIYGNTLLIPDTCYDLLFIKNNTRGVYQMMFLGMNDTYDIDQWDEADRDVSLFAIRFHFWTMNLITRFPMEGTLNQALDPREIFPGMEELCERIFAQGDFKARIAVAEAYLEEQFDVSRLNAPFFNGVEFMLKRKGKSTLRQLTQHLGYSQRQTQRIFQRVMGVSPKQAMSLVRYQCLWQEMLLKGETNYLDMVCKYGYTDQSHLIADFRRYHSMTPKEALENVVFFLSQTRGK